MSVEELDLPRDKFECVCIMPIELDAMRTEFSISFRDIDGPCEIKTCYGDICKIVNALMDYSRMLEMVCDHWRLEGFHRVTYEYHAEKLRRSPGNIRQVSTMIMMRLWRNVRKSEQKIRRMMTWVARRWKWPIERAFVLPLRLNLPTILLQTKSHLPEIGSIYYCTINGRPSLRDAHLLFPCSVSKLDKDNQTRSASYRDIDRRTVNHRV